MENVVFFVYQSMQESIRKEIWEVAEVMLQVKFPRENPDENEIEKSKEI